MNNNTLRDAMQRVNDREYFFGAIESRLSAPVSTTCHCCGAKIKTYVVEEYSWPDRRREPKAGLVVQCNRCGSRNQVVVSIPQATPKPKSETPKPKDPLRKVAGVLFTLALVVVLVILVIKFVPFGSGSPTSATGDDGTTEEIETVGTGTDEDENPEIQEDDTNTIADIISGFLSGDEDDTSSDSTVENSLILSETLSGIGNSFINISEGGMMVVVDEYVYYTNPTDEYRIYRMDLNFENAERIGGKSAFYLNYADGKLYFAESKEPYALYRMELNGSNVELITDRPSYEPKIVGDKLYYDDIDDNYALYCSDLDGSNETYITGGVAFYSCITDEHIYYVDTSDGRYCYQVDLDGRNKKVLFETSVRDICMLDDMLYFTLTDGGVYCYDTETENLYKISDLNARSLVANTDGWLYFGNLDKDGKLYKMTIDGEDVTKLSDDSVVFINVYSNLISYQDEDTDTFYWCLTDGSNLQPIE